jgi:hypothetical protein
MRNFLLALALLAPLTLTACADSAEQDAIDAGAPAGDMEDVVGDGEVIDEPGEMNPDDTMIEDGAPMGDSADVIGDGEIIDEAGEPDADAAGQ